jgi:hypothetical protein
MPGQCRILHRASGERESKTNAEIKVRGKEADRKKGHEKRKNEMAETDCTPIGTVETTHIHTQRTHTHNHTHTIKQ